MTGQPRSHCRAHHRRRRHLSPAVGRPPRVREAGVCERPRAPMSAHAKVRARVSSRGGGTARDCLPGKIEIGKKIVGGDSSRRWKRIPDNRRRQESPPEDVEEQGCGGSCAYVGVAVVLPPLFRCGSATAAPIACETVLFSHLATTFDDDNCPIHPLSGNPMPGAECGELPAGCQC